MFLKEKTNKAGTADFWVCDQRPYCARLGSILKQIALPLPDTSEITVTKEMLLESKSPSRTEKWTAAQRNLRKERHRLFNNQRQLFLNRHRERSEGKMHWRKSSTGKCRSVQSWFSDDVAHPAGFSGNRLPATTKLISLILQEWFPPLCSFPKQIWMKLSMRWPLIFHRSFIAHSQLTWFEGNQCRPIILVKLWVKVVYKKLYFGDEMSPRWNVLAMKRRRWNGGDEMS